MGGSDAVDGGQPRLRRSGPGQVLYGLIRPCVRLLDARSGPPGWPCLRTRSRCVSRSCWTAVPENRRYCLLADLMVTPPEFRGAAQYFGASSVFPPARGRSGCILRRSRRRARRYSPPDGGSDAEHARGKRFVWRDAPRCVLLVGLGGASPPNSVHDGREHAKVAALLLPRREDGPTMSNTAADRQRMLRKVPTMGQELPGETRSDGLVA